MGDYMGKGRRIQDFRNLKLDSSENNERRNNEIKSSMTEKEFIIEVEEKPGKKNIKNDKSQKDYAKKLKASAKKKYNTKTKNEKESIKNKKALKKAKSPKTYVEEETIKTKKEKQKKTSMVVSTALLILILIGVVAGCLTTPTFDVKYIEAREGQNVTSGEIQKYFTEYKGKNTFLINTEEISEIIESHPYIYKAEVNRVLPNKLSVEYIERKPYASLKYIESYVLTDKYGYILEILKENIYPDLPIIYGIETEEFVPGEKLEGISNLKFENTVYLLETAEHVSFDYKISEINYTDSENIKFSMNNSNVQIIYGAIERNILIDKIAYLNEVLIQLGDKKGALDISSSNFSEKAIFTEILK